jgi:hypothetical protein
MMRWLFGSKGTRRNDPVFGSMLYMGDRLKYWEGKARFAPESGKEIEVFVDAGETEDLERQYLFYEEVVGAWEKLLGKIRSAIAKKVGSTREMVLASVHVARAPLNTAEWELTFSLRGADEFATVRMKGEEPIDVALDT